MPTDSHDDLDRALQDPKAVFDTPMAVLRSDLAHDDKLAVLQRWESDARELSVAAEENMAGPGPEPDDEAGVLSEVRRAINTLERQPTDEAAATVPTKHGG